VVSDRLGHASVKITLDTYTHHVPELDRRAAEQVASLLDRWVHLGAFRPTTPLF
jgi:integrase